jgi:hypothetical protein
LGHEQVIVLLPLIDTDVTADAVGHIHLHLLQALGVLMALLVELGLERLNPSFEFVFKQAFPSGEFRVMAAAYRRFVLQLLLPVGNLCAESSVFFQRFGQATFKDLFFGKGAVEIFGDGAQ